MVIGIFNTVAEFINFLLMVIISLLGAAATAVATAAAKELDASSSVDAGFLAIPITFTILILAHAICTIVMVRKDPEATAFLG